MPAMPNLLAFDGGLTLAAPLVAVLVALLTRKVVPALLLGAVVGAFVAADGSPSDTAFRMFGYLREAVWNKDHLLVSSFSILVASAVGMMGASGGTRALVARIERVAAGRRGAMIASWLSGAVVFFDDYANCLVVGSAMGPLCDTNRVSRAKLSYIVDSTAAPVASLALVSTWVGYEVGLIDDALAKTAHADTSAFTLFLGSVPYGFYGIFTLIFVGAIAISGRDFGPMLAAERAMAAPLAGDAEVDANQHLRAASHAAYAAVPVAALVGLTFLWMVVQGYNTVAHPESARLFEILGAANPYYAMLAGSVAALVLAGGMALLGRAASPTELGAAAWESARAVSEALVVLYLAWTLGSAVNDAGAADFLAGQLGSWMSPVWLPAAVFGLAALIGFATGTSFGTMGILIPMVIPLGLDLTGGQVESVVMLASIAAVMAGAVLGDHASPISDTTVLSALGSRCELLLHVRTQLPYALSTGAIAMLLGFVPVGLGVPVWLCLGLGAVACVAVVWALGKDPSAAVAG